MTDSLYLFFFFFHCDGDHRDLHSFPTRRSSDLSGNSILYGYTGRCTVSPWVFPSHLSRERENGALGVDQLQEDRKSTRLNSSHVRISYAVFCLKKKKKQNKKNQQPKTTHQNSTI